MRQHENKPNTSPQFPQTNNNTSKSLKGKIGKKIINNNTGNKKRFGNTNTKGVKNPKINEKEKIEKKSKNNYKIPKKEKKKIKEIPKNPI